MAVSCNCFTLVSAPVNSDVNVKTSKRGVKYTNVNLSVSYYTGRKENPYASQLYQFALFNEDCDKFCEKVSRGDIITVIGIATCGKPFDTNKGDTITPIELKNPSWKCITPKNEGNNTGEADTEEDEF